MAAATPSTSAMKRTLSSSGMGSAPQSSQRKRHQPHLETSPSLAAEQMRRTYETQLTSLQLRLSESQAEVRREQSQRIESESTVAALERERRSLLERWDERQEDMQERVKADWLAEKYDLEREKGQLDVSLSESRQELEDVMFQLREAQHLVRQAHMAQEHAQEFARDLEAQNGNLRSELGRIQESRASPAPAASPSRPQRPASQVSADKVLQKQLSQQLAHVKSLESSNAQLSRENARLSAHVDHTALLRERLASVQGQVKSLPRLEAQLAQTQTELGILQAEQQSWLVFLSSDDDDNEEAPPKWRRPEDLARELSRVSSQNEVLQRRLEMAKETHGGMHELVAALEIRIDELEASVEKEKQTQTGYRKTIRGLERSEKLLQTERSFLLAQLDNYALERKLESDAAQEDESTVSRMRSELEQIKSQLQSAFGELQERPAAGAIPDSTEESQGASDVRQRFASLMQQNAALEEELSTLHTQLSVASKESASLGIQLDKLSHLVSGGAYDPSTTRVLEFKDNPASRDLAVRTQEMELLTKENKALLARLGGSSQGAPVPDESMAVLQAELKKVKETLEQKDKVAQRIKEAFRTRATEMRAAVAGLLGFKLDMKESGQIRLSSIYSPSSSRHLMFQPVSGSSNSGNSITEYKLVGDGAGLSPTEQQTFRFWVGERRCIPAWLANTFIEEYEGATRGGKFASVTYAD